MVASWIARLGIVASVSLIVSVALLAQHTATPEPEPELLTARGAAEERPPPMRERSERMAISRSSRAPAKAVTLVVRGAATEVESNAFTVGQLLRLLRVDVGPDDRVRPDPETEIRSGMDVVVRAVDVETEVDSEPIAFETVRRETSARERGTEVVVQEGQEGLREITIERVFVDGLEESMTVVDERVTDPVDRVVEVGTAPPPPPPEPKPAASTSSGDDSVWYRLAQCESNGNWQAVNPAGPYYGGLQFLKGTWDRVGGTDFAAYPHQASREEQITVGKRLQRAAGWGQWPACSSHLGLR